MKKSLQLSMDLYYIGMILYLYGMKQYHICMESYSVKLCLTDNSINKNLIQKILSDSY